MSVGSALSESTGLLLLQAVRTLAEVQAQAVSTRFAVFSQPLTFPAPCSSARLARAGSGGSVVLD
jgi:hypothetical protein